MSRKQHKYHFIYKTTCLLNENYYVGMHSTSNLEDGYLGSGKRLNYSIKKHGKENFKREILEYVNSKEDLKKREAELVDDDLLKDPKCMNLQHGGGGGFSGEEHRKKAIRAGNVARAKNSVEPRKILFSTKEWRDNFCKSVSNGMIGKSNGWKGKKHSMETKNKISKSNSISQSGEKNSQYGKCWVYNKELQQSKSIKREELSFYLGMNWIKGRKLSKI